MKKEYSSAKCFGRKLGMGIPAHDASLQKAVLTPLTNKFSAQHDVSMSSAIKKAHGSGTSAQMNKKNAAD